MTTPRKIFIASSLEMGAINQKFNWLADQYTRTDDPDEAEFIILDLSHFPVEQFMMFFGRKGHFYIPSSHAPILFAALEGQVAEEFDLIKKFYHTCYKCNDIPVYKSCDELLGALKWFEATFPFYNERAIPRLEMIEKTTKDMVLTRMRDAQSGEAP